ncbi:MAG: PAS domain S-box protein [Mucilaginibacter sp.]
MIEAQRSRTIVIISLITIAASLVVMAGWIFNIPGLQQIIPGFVSMVFNTALCFGLFGTALLLTQYGTGTFKTPAFFVLSLAGTLIGLVTLLQFLFHFNTGLDELFVTDWEKISASHLYAGRMAFNASVNVSLFGLGLLMLTAGKKTFNLVAQWLFHTVTFLSAIALIGYLYGASLFYSLFYVSSMATHTAVLFFILSLAATRLNPSVGIAKMFTGKEIGNRMGKRLYVLMLIPILAFGSLRVQTQHFGFLSLEVGISLLAVSVLLISLLLIWDTANRLNKIDEQRSAAEAEIKLINADLEKSVEQRSAEYLKSEEKYRSLIEHASDAIYIVDFKGYFTDVNNSMCKMTGYSRDELLHMKVEDIIDPEELKVDPVKHGPRDPDECIMRERVLLRKDGSLFTAEINVKMFHDDSVLVIARDVTSRKKMENELREAELKFRTIADKSMVGVYIFQQGKFVYVNPRFAEIFGYEPHELVGTYPVDTIIHQTFRDTVRENVRKRMEEEVGSIHYEVMGLKKDGSANWVEFYGNRALIGSDPTIIGTMLDITERKQAEEELRSSEQKYKLLFESSPMPLWMIAKDNLTIIATNDAAARLYGYSRDELINMSVTTLRPPDDRERQLAGSVNGTSAEASDMGVVTHLKKDGTPMYVQIIANDIIFEGRAVRLSFTNDITEKLKAEESLQKSEANLKTILNTTDTAYALFDTNLAVLAFNQKATEFVRTQYNHTPSKGDKLADYFPVERFPQFMGFAKEVLQGRNIGYEVDYPQRGAGASWFDVRLSPITNDRKEILGMLMALYDITERKTTENDLKNAYTRIQNQINSIKGMAWKQSHLMRSPLANLKALAAMLKEHPADTESLAHFQTELDRLDIIIHEMAQDASDHVA